MQRTDIINKLIKKFEYKTYLEIGVQFGTNFNRVKIDNKIGIDPDLTVCADLYLTSDEYFEIIDINEKFDIIFIDGMHVADQVYTDVKNALNHLNQNGCIVCHDMLPSSEIMQRVPRIANIWTGDCWKAWVWLRQSEPNLSMYVINTDKGCGVIRFGKQKLLQPDIIINYKHFQTHKKQWMNVISIDKFIQLVKTK